MIGLRFIRRVSWSAVLRAWKPQESVQSGWIKHYREKGYSSWTEWRTVQFAPLRPVKHRWRLYRVIDPTQTVPSWHGASFHGWRKKYYDQRRTPTFAQIITHPKIRRNRKILEIQRRFPPKSYMVGVVHKQKVYVIEGMHRACAIALSAKQHRPVQGQVFIFLMRRRRPLEDLSTPIKQN